MSALNRIGLGLLHRMDPERAHGLALRALRAGLVPLPGRVTSRRLSCEVAGLRLDNPIGLAAGFDKNAVALAPLARAGFGMIEVGAVTPRPQPGNPRPRLFRLSEDRGVINRFGFNNDGMEAAAERLAQRPKDAVIGLNLGANKDSGDRAEDFARVLAHCGRYLDFATVNVSSPNTEKLRDLQGGRALRALLAGVMEARDWLERPIPIFLKIAPDLDDAALGEIAEVAQSSGLAGIIATNTTLDRTGLTSPAQERGRWAVRRAAVRKIHAGSGAAVAVDGRGNAPDRRRRHRLGRGCLCQDPRGGQRGAALLGAGLRGPAAGAAHRAGAGAAAGSGRIRHCGRGGRNAARGLAVITLWHNPRCSKSRAALALLEERGAQVTVRRYLEDTPTEAELRAAHALLGGPVMAMMRPGEPAFRDMRLGTQTDDDTLFAAMAAEPRLIERPLALIATRAALGRPPEAVLTLLEG